jgi:transglutaminase-like putative cysteine protease
MAAVLEREPVVEEDLPAPDVPGDEPRSAVPPGRLTIAAGLAASGAAWPVSRLFTSPELAFAFALAGVIVAAAAGVWGLRRERLAALYLAVPLAAVVGAIAVAPFAKGGANLGSLVREAIDQGGLAQAPVALLPGWRFLLVLFFAGLTGVAIPLAASAGRPRLVVLPAAPVALLGTLLLPAGRELVGAGLAVALLIGAQTVASGAELAARGLGGAGFERRRMARGAAMLAATMVVVVAVSQTDFLFPDTTTDNVVPPRKPPTPPPSPDRELFRTDADLALTWRVGVLDVYGEGALLLPPYDPRRFEPLPADGALPVGAPAAVERRDVHVTVGDVPGQTVPVPALATGLRGVTDALVDPRTQVVRLGERRVPSGLRYTVAVPAPPDAAELAGAPAAPAALVEQFTDLPAPPAGVSELLRQAPAGPVFGRLQFVRQALYSNVVAAGVGNPSDVGPADVDAMLKGGNASPYAIVAAEVMIARWAGVPARMAFGFNGGDKLPDGSGRSIRPKHGAAWLEAYFAGRGWVPFVGIPPKAQAAINDKQKNRDERIQPSDRIALTVYVPLQSSSVRQAYEVARYYALLGAVGALPLIAAYLSIPFLCKALRRRRRRRWARRAGPAGRILVAYAEMRDRLHDLNVGDPTASALELIEDIEEDDEHEELAWLYTRALYGDLQRDLQAQDAEAGEEMAASVASRVGREQTLLNRVIAWLARGSLRDPFTREIPNVWRERATAVEPTRRRVGRRRAMARRLQPTAAVLALALLLVSCSRSDPRADTPVALPAGAVPTNVLGYDLAREENAESSYAEVGARAMVLRGEVYSVHEGDTTHGSVQLTVLKPRYNAQEEDLHRQIEQGFSVGQFHSERYGPIRLRKAAGFNQQVWLWFPADRNAMEVFVMRSDFAGADRFVRGFIGAQLGWDELPPVGGPR